MYFSRSLLLSLLATPFLALAQSPNAFIIPQGFSATAGQPLQLQWTPTTQGTVSLVLRSGASSDLNAGTTIASKISNSGSYSWTPATSITRGSDYTVEIVSDSDPTAVNYTPYFVIDSTNTVASSTADVTLGAPTSSVSASTVSPTGSASSVVAALSSSASSASSAAASSASTASTASSASASSAAATASSSTGSAHSTTTGSSATGSSTMATTTSSHASSASSASATQSAATTTTAAAAGSRVTAAAGLLGVVALGALAL